MLSNALIPVNWVLPLMVESVDTALFTKTARIAWVTLFAAAAFHALTRRSPLRLAAALPLLALAVFPETALRIDFSRATSAAAFQARADWLARDATLPELVPQIAEQKTFFDQINAAIVAVNAGSRPQTNEPLPEAGALAESIKAGVDIPLPLFRPPGLEEFRAEALAELADGSAPAQLRAMRKSLAISEFNLDRRVAFHSMLLAGLSLAALAIFALIGRHRALLGIGLAGIGVGYAVLTGSLQPAFSVVQTVFVILLLVVLQRLWRDNRAFLQALGRPKNLANLRRSLAAWSLFFVLFASALWVSSLTTAGFTRAVYAVKFPPLVRAESAIFRIEESGAGLEADLLRATEAHFAFINTQTSTLAATVADDLRAGNANAIAETMQRLERTISPVIFRRYENCVDPVDLICPLSNAVKAAINRSWRKARQAQLNAIERALLDMANDMENGVEGAAEATQARIDGATSTASNWSRQGISSTFLWASILNALSVAFLVFVLIKSFVFIASRVYLHADPENEAMWDQFAKPPSGGIPEAQPNSYTFEREAWGTFFTRRNQSNKNIKRDTTWPQLRSMLLRRLATRSLAFYREDWSRDQGDKTVKNTKGGQFVAWQLAEGQRVVFNLRALAAFSETVRLKSLWSFRLSHFIFGRTLFSSAQGPGMILLSTQGEPHIGQPGERFTFGAAPAEYIAFDLATDFLVLSDLKLKNIYFSDIEVVANDASRAVVDVIPDLSLAGGAAKFFRAFFIPV